jgi:glycosyltransferase involved in cell wall biosynthesis
LKVAIDARLIGGTSTGDSTYWTCFLEALSQNQPSVELVFISNQEKPTNVPFLERYKWIVAPARSGRWWSMVTFPLLARKIGAQITHGQYGISPLCRNGVSTIHDISFMINPTWFSERDQTLLKAGAKLTTKVAKRIITVSQTSKDEIDRYFPIAKSKTRVALNACPPWIHRTNASPGVEGNYVLTVGTNWARKNMVLALEAVKNISDLKIVVTGKNSYDFRGENIEPTGYVDTDRLSALYSNAKLYLAPSLHEGFGIPLLEAMRCGTPVICGPGGAMPEVAGNAALVMPDYDPETWGKAINKLVHDPSKLSELEAKGIEREREFTWLRSAEAHYQAYRELL